MAAKKKEMLMLTYRALVTLHPQMSLFDINESEAGMTNERDIKHSRISSLYDYICEQKKIEYNRGDTQRYILLVIREISNKVLLCKLAKIHEEVLYNLKDDDINEQTIDSYPFVYVVFHLPNQSFLIEKRSRVFTDASSAKNVLEQLLNEKMQQYRAELSILPITSELSFWDGIKDFEKIDELTLFLKSPNLWLGEQSTEDALKELQAEYSNDELELTLRSSTGSMKPDNKKMRNVIGYIMNGGGWWKVKGKSKKDGKNKTLNSKDNVKALSLPENPFGNASEEILSEIDNAVAIKESDANA